MSETTNSKKNQNRNMWIASSILVVIIGAIMMFMRSSDSGAAERTPKVKFSNPTEHSGTQQIIVEKAQREISELRRKNELLNKKVENELSSQMTQQSALMERLKKLESEKNAIEIKDKGNLFNEQKFVPMQVVDKSLQEVQFSLPKKKTRYKPKRNTKNYVPSGTFVKAVMLGGADASAAIKSQATVSPMLFRITEEGTLPNGKKSHLKGCFVTGAVIGDISSERGLIRTEQLSCVFPSGRILDTKVDGTIFGGEGKNGVRGNPVWREKALLQRAFAAGALSGLADGIATTYTNTSVSPEGLVASVKDGKVFQMGAAKGLGKAMDKLADYNIQRAEQYHPVIQISAGTVVDIVFIKGFSLEEDEGETPPIDVRSKDRDLWDPTKIKYNDDYLQGEG